MFEQIKPAPPDPILGLTEAFKADPHPKKINLGVGVYKDASGQTPVLASVKAAEERLLRSEHTKNYLPIDGQPEFDSVTQELLIGADHPLVRAGCVVTAQRPAAPVRCASRRLHRVHARPAHRLAQRPDLAEPSGRFRRGGPAHRHLSLLRQTEQRRQL
jgi:aspartate/tyrosine/aromatic aminotransferase